MHICFWRYELQNTTTIPNKEGVFGPGNDTTLKNYSEFWNASKTKFEILNTWKLPDAMIMSNETVLPSDWYKVERMNMCLEDFQFLRLQLNPGVLIDTNNAS